MNVHSYCQGKVANLCGINQKLLAEALSHISQVDLSIVATSELVYYQVMIQFMDIVVILIWVFRVQQASFLPQKPAKKTDDGSAIGIYQDFKSAKADPSGKKLSLLCTLTRNLIYGFFTMHIRLHSLLSFY